MNCPSSHKKRSCKSCSNPHSGTLIWYLPWGSGDTTPGPCLNIKTVFPGVGIPMLKIRRSWDRLIFNMGNPIPVRRHIFYMEMAPSFLCSLTFFSFFFQFSELLTHCSTLHFYSVLSIYHGQISLKNSRMTPHISLWGQGMKWCSWAQSLIEVWPLQLLWCVHQRAIYDHDISTVHAYSEDRQTYVFTKGFSVQNYHISLISSMLTMDMSFANCLQYNYRVWVLHIASNTIARSSHVNLTKIVWTLAQVEYVKLPLWVFSISRCHIASIGIPIAKMRVKTILSHFTQSMR